MIDILALWRLKQETSRLRAASGTWKIPDLPILQKNLSEKKRKKKTTNEPCSMAEAWLYHKIILKQEKQTETTSWVELTDFNC